MPTESAAVERPRSYDRDSSLFRAHFAARAVCDKASPASDRGVGSSWQIRDPKCSHQGTGSSWQRSWLRKIADGLRPQHRTGALLTGYGPSSRWRWRQEDGWAAGSWRRADSGAARTQVG